MKHKVSELEGALLDTAVAKARDTGPTGELDWLHYTSLDFSPSTKWDHGGPIIERERIALSCHAFGGGSYLSPGPEQWCAHTLGALPSVGPTTLVAAMRAYVISKLGEEVELL